MFMFLFLSFDSPFFFFFNIKQIYLYNAHYEQTWSLAAFFQQKKWYIKKRKEKKEKKYTMQYLNL